MPIETWSRCIHVICIDMFHVFHSPCFSFRWLFERLGALPSGGIGPPAASYMCGCPLGGRGAFFQWRIWCNSGLRGKIREAFMTFHEFFSFSCSLYHPVVPLHGVGMPILLSLLSNQPRWSIFVFAQQRVGLMLHMSTTPWTDDPFFFSKWLQTDTILPLLVIFSCHCNCHCFIWVVLLYCRTSLACLRTSPC